MKAPWEIKYVECPKCHGTGILYDDEGNESECDMCRGDGEINDDDEEYQDWVYRHTPGDIED